MLDPSPVVSLQQKKPDAKHVLLYVASAYPEWQVAVMQALADAHTGTGFPKTVMRQINAMARKLGLSKAKLKDLMSFAAMKRKEVETKGPDALNLDRLPFDETAVLTEATPYIVATLGAESVTVSCCYCCCCCC